MSETAPTPNQVAGLVATREVFELAIRVIARGSWGIDDLPAVQQLWTKLHEMERALYRAQLLAEVRNGEDKNAPEPK